MSIQVLGHNNTMPEPVETQLLENLKVEPLASKPSCLGGVDPAVSLDRLSVVPFYASLVRPQSLKAWPKVDALAKQPALESVIRTLYDEGRMMVDFCVHRFDKNNACMLICNTDAHDVDECLFQIRTVESGDWIEQEHEFSDLIHRLMPGEDISQLYCRILHHFFRQHGAKVRDVKLVVGCLNLLADSYVQFEKWKDRLDVLLIRADLLICSEAFENEIKSKALYLVAKALQGVGRFSDAGSLLEEAARTFYAESSLECRIELYSASAIAFHSGKQWSRMKYATVSTLVWWLRDCEKKGQEISPWFEFGIVKDHLDRLAESYSFWQSDGSCAEMVEFSLILRCLLSNASALRHELLESHARKVLRDDARTVEGSQAYLIDAIHSASDSDGNVDCKAFRSALKRSLRAPFTFRLDYDRVRQYQEYPLQQSWKKGSKKHFRDIEIAKISSVHSSFKCCNPNCPGGEQAGFSKLMKCPCNKTKYCSKECHVEHWKNGHREECTARKKKGKKGGEGSSKKSGAKIG